MRDVRHLAREAWMRTACPSTTLPDNRSPISKTISSQSTLLAQATCILLVAACAAPVSVTRVDPRTVHRELTANALSAATPSGFTRNVLYEWNLSDRFDKEPEMAIGELHDAVVTNRAGADAVFALAQLSFLHAETTGTHAHYLAAAVYAFAFA